MAEPLKQTVATTPELEPAGEEDVSLLTLEQALHRGDGLIVVTSRRGNAHSSLVRTALARFDDAYVVVIISPAHGEPAVALDRLLETAGEDVGNGSNEEKQAALARLVARAAELGQPVVVVVEDAHLATVDQLERLRTGLRIEPGTGRPVQLVLAGTRKLMKKLRKPEARGLWTRIGTHVETDGERAEEPSARAAASTEASARTGSTARPRNLRWAVLSAAVLLVGVGLIGFLAERSQPPVETPPAERIAATPVDSADRSTRPAARPVEPVRPPAAGSSSDLEPPTGRAPGAEQEATIPGVPAAVPPLRLSPPGIASDQQQAAGERRVGGARIRVEQGVETVRGQGIPRAEERVDAGARTATGAGESPPVSRIAPTGPQGAGEARAAAKAGSSRAALVDVQPAPGARAAGSPPQQTSGAQAPAASSTGHRASPLAAASAPAVEATPPTAALPTRQATAARGYDVQIGAFRTRERAEKLRDRLAGAFPDIRILEAEVAGTTYYRVRIGPIADSGTAAEIEARLRELGFEPVRFRAAAQAG